MVVFSKSIYEPANSGDGIRVLTTNCWPRGISRQRAGAYKRILGPSRDLLRAFKAGEIDWAAYEPRYLEEMQGDHQQAEIRELAELARSQTVTVMCVCRDDVQCHRRLLKELIKSEMSVQA